MEINNFLVMRKIYRNSKIPTVINYNKSWQYLISSKMFLKLRKKQNLIHGRKKQIAQKTPRKMSSLHCKNPQPLMLFSV